MSSKCYFLLRLFFFFFLFSYFSLCYILPGPLGIKLLFYYNLNLHFTECCKTKIVIFGHFLETYVLVIVH